MSCAVILVTYNSQPFLPKVMSCLEKQTVKPKTIIIVDTGSKDKSYLPPESKGIKVVFAEQEAGFCKGNNIGYYYVENDCDYVFLLNPDAFPAVDYIEKAIYFMERRENAHCGALTGITLGYDIEKDQPTGKYDTTGIFPTWYGKWTDRLQGFSIDKSAFKQKEEIPAICGAVFFCRKKALNQTLIRGNEILDSTFYMYKEDIDLSLRLRKKNWQLVFLPSLIAHHCRGWNTDRTKMPKKMRLISARNEFTINKGRFSISGMIYSAIKFTAVKLFDL
jgi:N-acetylglucosaminyl-diphospho-decaprenol L-rhamnosyltransferase